MFDPQILSVDRLNAYLRVLLEEDPILSDVWVRGEVTNFHRSAAGHCYFSISNDGSQLRCALFRNAQRGLLVMPRNGDEVLVHGRVSIYEGTGQYQLYVDNVVPEGTGILQLQFEEMRRRLEAEGLFALDRKRPLPERPRIIGVVTSAQGAVWHDICNVISRRYPHVHLILSPSTVQGPEAPGELIAGLEALQQHGDVDVIIIGRGGGSAEDLAAFNDEQLARAIYASSVPVVSAVGHETDISIADLVADVRAPTPSAAAEICVPDQRELMANITRYVEAARDVLIQKIRTSRRELNVLELALSRFSPDLNIDHLRQDIDLLGDKSSLLLRSYLIALRTSVTTQERSARLLDPKDVLRRGYALVTTDNGASSSRVSSAADAGQQDRVRITFSDGSVAARVQKEQV